MRLAISVATCLLAGWIGSLLTRPSLAVWYQSLVKPDWTPPSWLFAPVWTTLYVLMAIAAWLVWRRTNLHATAMKVFLVQLVLNVIWSAIFFALRSPGWAFF